MPPVDPFVKAAIRAAGEAPIVAATHGYLTPWIPPPSPDAGSCHTVRLSCGLCSLARRDPQNTNLMLNNREWAILIWGAGIFVTLIARSEIRSSIGQLFRTLLSPALLIPLLLMIAYVVGEIWLGHKAQLWRSGLTKDTIVWFIVSALVFFFGYDQASKQPHFFRRRLVAAISIPIFIEFFANLYVLNLIAELALQPILLLLGLLIAVAESDERFRVLRTPLNTLLAVIGLSLLAYSVRQLFISWDEVDKPITALQFALPIWLTIGILPYIYLLNLYSNYQKAFHAIDVHSDSRRARLRAKLALIATLHFRARDSNAFGGWPWLDQIVSAPTFRATRRVVANFRESRREKERAAAEEQERLRRYTGSDDTDAEGRRLDRREFKETTKALSWLADCMEGWYHNEERGSKRYRADLLKVFGSDFFKPFGLPQDPGITMKVAKNGKAWYAWRRTVTGWYFAIGAAGPPPDRWEYDGPEPPRRFPPRGQGWGDKANQNWTVRDDDNLGRGQSRTR
jgi:hypothetical protein